MSAHAATPLPPASSVLDPAHPFTRALLGFAVVAIVGYVALVALALRLYVILPDRVKRSKRPTFPNTTAAAAGSRSSSSPAKARSPSTLRARRPPPSAATAGTTRAQTRRSEPATTLVVLGSGGHTKEMLTMLRGLDRTRYRPAVFVRAESDTRSDGMVKTAGGSVQPDATLTVPRSRSVGQSWLTTPFTTLYALWASVGLVFRLRPDLIICNGPGTCLPICLAGYALRFLGVKHVKVVFIESFCRVQSLSLTGRLLYYLADRFVVQWPGLVERYPLAEYIGQLC